MLELLEQAAMLFVTGMLFVYLFLATLMAMVELLRRAVARFAVTAAGTATRTAEPVTNHASPADKHNAPPAAVIAAIGGAIRQYRASHGTSAKQQQQR